MTCQCNKELFGLDFWTWTLAQLLEEVAHSCLSAVGQDLAAWYAAR